MALGQKEDEGTHTHMMVIGHLDTYYTLGDDGLMRWRIHLMTCGGHTPMNFIDIIKIHDKGIQTSPNDTQVDHLKW